MATPNVTVSVVLMVGNTTGNIGTVELPLLTKTTPADDGVSVEVRPDMTAFLSGLADLLHGTANEITDNAMKEAARTQRLSAEMCVKCGQARQYQHGDGRTDWIVAYQATDCDHETRAERDQDPSDSLTGPAST